MEIRKELIVKELGLEELPSEKGARYRLKIFSVYPDHEGYWIVGSQLEVLNGRKWYKYNEYLEPIEVNSDDFFVIEYRGGRKNKMLEIPEFINVYLN